MEARAQQLTQALDTSEIGLVDGAGRFHFDADVLSAPLHDDVNLIPILVPKVVKTNPFRVRTGLLFNFTEYKCFEQLTEQVALLIEFRGTAAKETACQPGISKVELGALDQSLNSIAVPGW